jgi:hypothetical protein
LAVASELCGLHAQVMSSADLTMWARVEGWRRGDLSTALWTDRSLVKIWAMRGTLHLLPASEHPLWASALRTYAHFRRESWARYYGVSSSTMDRLIATIGDVLHGAELTREDLAVAVRRRSRSKRYDAALLHSWGGLLKPASYQGVLCFAPSDGQRVRFTSPRSWLGIETDGPEPEEARRLVVRRFLAGYGPASSDEVARWWGALSPARTEAVIRSLGDDVVMLDVEGTQAWVLAEDEEAVASAKPTRTVRLLPGFDQYVIGSTKHSDRLMPGDFRDRVHRQAGWVSPVLAVDGRIEGVWSHATTPKAVSVTVEPFTRQPGWVRKGAQAEAERLAAYLGGAFAFDWKA